MTAQLPTREWRICIRHPDPANMRRCVVDIDFQEGTTPDCRNIPCELPPEFADLLAPPTGPQPQRRWRLKKERLTALGDEGIMFGAGDLATLQSIGERLHRALFAFPQIDLSEVLAAFSGNQRIRLALQIEPGSPLERVPWEAMYSPRLRRFLATSIHTNLVRLHDPIVQRAPPDPIDGPIHVLVAVANPALDLDTDLEVASIRRRFDELVSGAQRTRFELSFLEGVNRTTFKEALRRRPHIIHFIGHGDFDVGEDRGLLLFHHERNPDKAEAISAEQLGSMLQNYEPWMVVLNSCLSARASKADPFGGAAQSLIGLGVPFVVAMQYPISDDAAVAFSQSFYASIAENASVTDAVSQARNEIETLSEEELRPELITPVLYLPTTGTIDKVKVASPAAASAAVPAAAPADSSAPVPIHTRRLAWLAFGVLGAISATLATLWFVSDRLGALAPESRAPSATATSAPDRSPALAGDSAAVPEGGNGSIGENHVSAGRAPDGMPNFILLPPPPVTPPPGAAPPPPDGGVPPDQLPSPPGPAIPETQEPPLPDGGLGSDIVATGARRSSRLDLFLGGALSTSWQDRGGFSAAVGVNARYAGWSMRAEGKADILGGRARRQRLGAGIAAQHRVGEDGAYLSGRLAYSRQDMNGVEARGTAGVSLGYQSNLGNLRWSVEAGPVVRRTRWTAAATSNEVAASTEVQVALPVTYDLDVRLGGGATIGKTVSGHVTGAMELGLTRDLTARTSVDIDLEDQRVQGAHRSAVIGRIGLGYRF